MECFDKFETEFKKIGIDGVARIKNEVIKLWINEEKVSCGQVKIGDSSYLTIKFTDMDQLCNFIVEAQRKYL